MGHPRIDIISAAKTCIPERKYCPRSCPLIREGKCQKIICRELIKIYNEMKGLDTDGEDEPVCEEEETQEES